MSKNAPRTGVEVPLGRPSHLVFQETAWKVTGGKVPTPVIHVNC